MVQKSNKKIGIILGVIALLIITNITTFLISVKMQIKQDDKVIVNLKEYEELVNKYNEYSRKYSKSEWLQKFLKENYLGDITEKEMMTGSLKGIFESLEGILSGGIKMGPSITVQ